MITPQLIDQIETIISRAGLSSDSVAALRTALPEHHFTYCLDDDIGAGIAPVRTADGFNLYLITADDHCLRFTRDIDAATGLVLAEVGED